MGRIRQGAALQTEVMDTIAARSASGTFVNSREVASGFGKLHKNVLRAIDNIECSAEFKRLNFEPCLRAHPTVPGRVDRSYNLTRDGLAFLIFGFTGEAALKFKLRFITKFNEMERLLSESPRQTESVQPSNDLASAARAWAAQYENGLQAGGGTKSSRVLGYGSPN